ncbi:MAG TPA: RHS repeat-associated core domain-containing protein, partial [Thermoanaerobaculia bacterium]|nr:RHS repeat-associated core domain-containing protein [Thermoanaerobaculia bacterium]
DPATGRPASIKVTSPNSNFAATTSFGYDDLGEASRVTYGVPSSPMSVNAPARVAGNRFNRGFLIGVDYGTSTPSTRLLNLGYHATGIVNDVCFGSGAGCASHDVISIDKKGIARPGSVQWTWSGGGATTGTYAYDGAGNISGMDTDAFAYDKSGRLVQAKIGALQQSYSYDAAGNLKSMPAGATVDSNTNRLSTATYDGAGNVKSLPDLRPMVRRNDPTAMLNFRYDYSGEQVWLGASGISRSFIYDDQDERVAVIDAKAGQPKHERWSVRDLDKKVIRDFDRTNAVWSWTKDFLYRDATAAGTISMNGSVEELHQLHADHLGTVRIVTTSTGALYGGAAGAYPQKYWPFGDPVISATLADRLVFTGHERDDDGTLDTQADIDYMHARYYAPVAGRFLSPDRVNGKPETPQSWNRYSYTLNSPLRYVDPNGKQAAPPPVVLIGSGADLKVAVPSTPGGMYNPTSAAALKEWELGIEGISAPKGGWSSVRMAKELGANVLKYHITGVEVRHVGPKPSVFKLLYEDRIPYAFEVAADNLAVGTKAAYKTTAKVVAGTANASLKLFEFLGTAPGQAVLMFFDAKPAGYTADNPDPAGIEQYQPEEYRDKKK